LHNFASGGKRNYYGKGDVIAYRLTPGYFGANVTMLLYGDAFWPTYTTGDNTGLVATDSMKNFIQRETGSFTGHELEPYCRFLAEKFLAKYPQTEGIQVTAAEIPYASMGGDGYTPAGPEHAMAAIEMRRGGEVVEQRSGLHGFKLLRLSGSAFTGFVRDEYTTLPEMTDRPLHMWLDLEWTAAGDQCLAAPVRSLVRDVFLSFESGSIQQIIYKVGCRMLSEFTAIREVRLEADNRTWDQVAGHVYTDPRPPYGCLGLTLRRE
jgi:urate oxidase/2-oxo-4-hydroxy-4-carboxy-5-ureidoimidazoline decarboxylase